MKDEDTTATYKYNPQGYRVEKTVNGLTTLYLYEGDKVVLETDKNNNQKALQVYGINLIYRSAVKEAGTEKYYYLYNAHGDVTSLINPNGIIAATYDYDAFGNVISKTGNTNNSILYAGYQHDGESGLYYLNARYYDSVTARFITEDTYTGKRNDPLSLNLYSYCYNNPMIYNDPSGHIVETVLDVASTASSAYDFAKNPTLANAGFLAWDVASMILPGVPGSYVAKAVKGASKAVKAVKSTSKVAVKSASKVDNAIKAGSKVASKASKGSQTASKTTKTVSASTKSASKTGTKVESKEFKKAETKATTKTEAKASKKSESNADFKKGSTRTEALNKAKDWAGVPRSQQASRQWTVGDDITKKGADYKNYEYSNNASHQGRYYEYDTPQGKKVVVDHINDVDQGLHTHAGTAPKGADPFKYDFKNPDNRYSPINKGTNHHIPYSR